MARIEKRKIKRGISYLATVRRKGLETVARTFDTKGEAIAWATGVEQDMKDQRYQNPRRAMNTSFGQALEKYINTISQKKAINTHVPFCNGRRNSTTSPPSVWLRASMLPPCINTACFAMARPIPFPPLSRFRDSATL